MFLPVVSLVFDTELYESQGIEIPKEVYENPLERIKTLVRISDIRLVKDYGYFREIITDLDSIAVEESFKHLQLCLTTQIICHFN